MGLPLLAGCLPAAFLTLFGLASIGLSCLLALFLYHVAFGVRYLGILNGVAAFVIVGIGECQSVSSGPWRIRLHVFCLP